MPRLPQSPFYQDQDSLIHFFSILAFSSESELGFDTEIERVNNSDFELRFCVEEVRYLTSGVLFDIGADATCGRGTRVFEAYQEVQEDDENKVPCIVKDCWVEDCEGKCMEHEIIQQVRGKICSEKFREHFVDFCGYRKTTNEPLDRFCRILTNKTFNVQDVQEWSETLVWTVAAKHHTNYTKSGQAFVSDQRSHLRPTPPPARPQRLPHPRFRYQIVYTEKGTSLHCVTSLSNTFRHLAQVTDGMNLSIITYDASSLVTRSTSSPQSGICAQGRESRQYNCCGRKGKDIRPRIRQGARLQPIANLDRHLSAPSDFQRG